MKLIKQTGGAIQFKPKEKEHLFKRNDICPHWFAESFIDGKRVFLRFEQPILVIENETNFQIFILYGSSNVLFQMDYKEHAYIEFQKPFSIRFMRA